jgi:hypothetical protein
MSRISSRIAKLARWSGLNDGPRRVLIMFGTSYEENWIEPGCGWVGSNVHLMVRIPSHGDDPRLFLTEEQESEIRPDDSVAAIEIIDNRRDRGLQRFRPPWKRSSGNGSQAVE